jgi:Domain of unknown function (DUF4407)
MSKPGQFLITLSGARADVLALCPGERIKFQSLGWAILITAGMAVVSMWFALTSAMGVEPIAALPIALLWGLVIMGIDRWLVTSIPYDRPRKWLMAAPRLALAILLGSLISTPIVLRVFQSEINNQISVIKETNEADFLSSQQHSSVQTRVTKWQHTVANLEQVITTNGAQPINPANDLVVQGLTTQLNAERKVATQDYNAWQCQLYGGCDAPKGSGPLAQASQQRYQADEVQITTLTNEISAREQTLRNTSAAAQQTRLQQAKDALPNAQAQLAAAQGEENSLLNNFQNTNKATNGLLIRLQALDQLSAQGGTLSLVRWLLFLLFLVIEILPVSVKLMQQPGLYEQVLRTADQHQLRRARWILRSGAGATSPTEGPSVGQQDLRPTTLDGGFGARGAGRDLSSADLVRLFQRTETRFTSTHEPTYSWNQSHLGPDASAPEPAGSDRLDEELRGLADARPTADFNDRFGDVDTVQDAYEERHTGIERRYGDDDL